MPLPIGTASIAFGLVNVPVRIYPATQDHDIRFRMVLDKDGGQINYRYKCAVCGETVEYYDIDRAYESAEGHRVIVTDDDLAGLPAAEKSEIAVLQFVPTEQIDPILLQRSYYLEPAAATPRAYALLAETLARTDRTAVVHFTLRHKTRLGALRVRGNLLVLQSLLWPVRVPGRQGGGMCGRYATTASVATLMERFEVAEQYVDAPTEPDYNVAPTKTAPAVLCRPDRDTPEAEPHRQIRSLRWGLVPFWADSVKVGSRMINARAETVHERRAYRAAFKARRCLLPAAGFYEWFPTEEIGKSGRPLKQPFYIHRSGDDDLLTFAGIYEFWRDPELPKDDPQAWVVSYSVVTTTFISP